MWLCFMFENWLIKSFTGITIKHKFVRLKFYQNKREYELRCLNINWKYSIVLELFVGWCQWWKKNLSLLSVATVIGFHNTDLVGE